MAQLITADGLDKVVGWKVGATSSGVQQAEGYDGPIPGRIFASTLYHNPAEIPSLSCPLAKLEAEIAFSLRADLDRNQHPFTAQYLADKVVLHPAFDITSTRYSPESRATWDKMQNMLAGIADNGNGGAIVVGPAIQGWQDISLMDLSVILSMNDGAAVKNLYGSSRGDPFDAFIWTVNSVYERGFDLHLGDYILTGSLTEPQFLQQGDQAIARYPNMGELSLIFS